MKMIGKIIFFIFFFLVSFTNIGNDTKACQQATFSNPKSAQHYSLENNICESYIAIQSNSCDIPLGTELNKNEQSNFTQKFYFNNKISNKYYHTISFLYKTEIFPNAP